MTSLPIRSESTRMLRRALTCAGITCAVLAAACQRSSLVTGDLQQDLERASSASLELAPRAKSTAVVSALELGKAAAPSAPAPQAHRSASIASQTPAPVTRVASRSVATAEDDAPASAPTQATPAPSPAPEAAPSSPEPSASAPNQLPPSVMRLPSPTEGPNAGTEPGRARWMVVDWRRDPERAVPDQSLMFLISRYSEDESMATNDTTNDKYQKPNASELKARLSPLQYKVTQEEGTEPPFRNEYWNNHEPGIYVDVVTGEPLFGSLDKFDSGTGWPSFTRPLAPDNVTTKTDRSLFMARTEVRSACGNSHLGHVFEDGPAPTGLRYCMNSAAMRFIPASQLAAEGYGEFADLFA